MTVFELEQLVGKQIVTELRREKYVTCFPYQSGQPEVLPSTDIKYEGIFLKGEYGIGSTPNESLQDYLAGIAGQTLVLNPHGENRREVEIPIHLTLS